MEPDDEDAREGWEPAEPLATLNRALSISLDGSFSPKRP